MSIASLGARVAKVDRIVTRALLKGYPEYNEDQPRGDNGQWSGGLGAHAAKPTKSARAYATALLKAGTNREQYDRVFQQVQKLPKDMVLAIARDYANRPTKGKYQFRFGGTKKSALFAIHNIFIDRAQAERKAQILERLTGNRTSKGYPEYNPDQARGEDGRWLVGGGVAARTGGARGRGGKKPLPPGGRRVRQPWGTTHIVYPNRGLVKNPPNEFRPPDEHMTVAGQERGHNIFVATLAADRKWTHGIELREDDKRALDEYIQRFTARDGMTVYGRLPFTAFDSIISGQLRPGMIMNTLDFLDTSVSIEAGIAGGHPMEIVVPKGMNIAPPFKYTDLVEVEVDRISRDSPLLSGARLSLPSPNQEFLVLPRGSRLRYTGTRTTMWPGIEHKVYQFKLVAPRKGRR